MFEVANPNAFIRRVHPKPCVVRSIKVDLVVSTAVNNGVVVSNHGNVLTDAVVKKLNDPHGNVPL